MNLKENFRGLKDKFLLLPMLFDIAFLFFFGFVFDYFKDNLLFALEEIIKIIKGEGVADCQ